MLPPNLMSLFLARESGLQYCVYAINSCILRHFYLFFSSSSDLIFLRTIFSQSMQCLVIFIILSCEMIFINQQKEKSYNHQFQVISTYNLAKLGSLLPDKRNAGVYWCYTKMCTITVEPRFNDLQFNDVPGITVNIRQFPGKSYSKMYGAEPQFNDLRFNDIPGLTMGILFPEGKIFPGITIKSI